jgi:hypothetical protein
MELYKKVALSKVTLHLVLFFKQSVQLKTGIVPDLMAQWGENSTLKSKEVDISN